MGVPKKVVARAVLLSTKKMAQSIHSFGRAGNTRINYAGLAAARMAALEAARLAKVPQMETQLLCCRSPGEPTQVAQEFFRR